MPEHEALIELDVRLKTFKVSGSEAFIERMLDVLPSLLPQSSEVDGISRDAEDSDSNDAGASSRNLDDFVAKADITDAISGEKKVCAFVYYLIKVAKNAHATAAQIAACFDEAGLKTPENLTVVINNTRSRSKSIRSLSPGTYDLTTKGNNLVKGMFKGTS